MGNILHILLLPLTVLVGAGDIHMAIFNFKRGKYYLFGMWVMFAVWSVLLMIKTVFDV